MTTVPLGPLFTATLALRGLPVIAALPHVIDLVSAFLDSSVDIPLHQACAMGSFALLDRIWTASQQPRDESRRWCPTASVHTTRHYKRWQFSQSLIQAIRRRDKAMVEWIFSHFSQCVSDVEVEEEAAATGQLDMLELLLEKDSGYTQEEYEDGNVADNGNGVTWGGRDMELAAKNGHHDVVRWIYENKEFAYRREERVLPNLVRSGGDLSLFQWLYSEEIEVGDWFSLFDEAAAVGNLALLQWLVEDDGGRYKIPLPSNHLDVIRWMLDANVARDVGGAFADACGHSPLPVVWWLAEYVTANSVAISKSKAKTALDSAAAHGRLEVVQWLHNHNYGKKSRHAIHLAAANGKLEVVKYLHSHGFTGCHAVTMEYAAQGGHFDVVQWLWTEFGGKRKADLLGIYGKQEVEGEAPFARAMDAAASNGHLAVLQYLYEIALSLAGKKRKRGVDTRHPSAIVMDNAVTQAARHRHLPVVQWLCDNTTVKKTEYAMCYAARWGDMAVIQWLHENRTERYTTMVMNVAATVGELKVLKWLRANRPGEGYSSSGLHKASGNLAVLRWLLNLPPTKVYTKQGISEAVMLGHFDAVLFWYEVGGERSANGIRWDTGERINKHILAWLFEELDIVPDSQYDPQSEDDSD